MKLARFTESGRTRIGVVIERQILDLGQAAPGLPTTMSAFLAAGPAAMERARAAATFHQPTLSLAEVRLEAPVARPGKVLAIGLNYADHIAEMGRKRPEHQIWFNKAPTAVTGPSAPVLLPATSTMVDYEGELAFFIGRRCRNVPRARAHEVIAGFTVANDVSVRDWQMRSPTMTLGKSFDTHCPTGPWIVTPDELGDPHSLGIRTWVNGELRQNSTTHAMIYDCYAQIAHLSSVLTLEPGDLILTGTPAGVGAGHRPPLYLQAGDVVRVEIARLGAIENRFVPDRGETVIL